VLTIGPGVGRLAALGDERYVSVTRPGPRAAQEAVPRAAFTLRGLGTTV